MGKYFDYISSITPFIAQGSLVTLSLFALTLLISIPLGIVLALGNVSRLPLLRNIIRGYILIMRGTPLMLQILFMYFGVPIIINNMFKGLVAYGIISSPAPRFILDNFTASVAAFSLNYAAYFAEIFRGGINSISHGQLEAAQALGFSRFQTMRLVILPQAFANVLPSVSNETITLVKDTALVQIIALEDVLRKTNLIVSRDLTVVPFFVAAVFYLIMTAVLTFMFSKVEGKFNYRRCA